MLIFSFFNQLILVSYRQRSSSIFRQDILKIAGPKDNHHDPGHTQLLIEELDTFYIRFHILNPSLLKDNCTLCCVLV